MTLFSSNDYHENRYSERHGQNVVYVRKFRKIGAGKPTPFLQA